MALPYPGAVLYENPIFETRSWSTEAVEISSDVSFACGDHVFLKSGKLRCYAVVLAVSTERPLLILISLQTGHSMIVFGDELELVS